MKEKSKIDKVCTRPKKGNVPTLLKFQNGKVSAIAKEQTQYCQMVSEKTKRKSAMVVSHGHIYHGVVNADEKDELTDTYICVRNKSTSKVRIIPIDQALLNNHVYNELEKKQQASISKENAMRTLLKQFGGRKASRYVTNQENMKMNIDVVKEELDTTIHEASFTEESEPQIQSEQHFESIRPKCDKEAKQVNQVYNINDVVPADLMERLEEEAKVVYATAVDKLPITSEYIISSLTTLKKSTASTECILKIKMLIYMDCLLNLIKTRARSLKNIELSGITEKVENDVRERFFDPNGKKNMRTMYTTEKALCHFIVLALLSSDNFQVDITALAQELCAPRAKIVKYAHIVNARPKAKSNILALQLPSKVPPMPTKFARRSALSK